MRPYPDLIATRVKAVLLDCHARDGLPKIEAFWKRRGEYPEHVAVGRYVASGRAHTVSIEWTPSHRQCVNISVSVWASRTPSQVFPGLTLSTHRLRIADFLAFVDLLRTLELVRGIRSRYVYSWSRPLKGWIELPPPVRMLSLSFEVLDEDQAPVLKATQQRVEEGWEVVLEPAGRMDVPDSAADFFTEPLKLISVLSPSIK